MGKEGSAVALYRENPKKFCGREKQFPVFNPPVDYINS